jgi:hypothetical protein
MYIRFQSSALHAVRRERIVSEVFNCSQSIDKQPHRRLSQQSARLAHVQDTDFCMEHFGCAFYVSSHAGAGLRKIDWEEYFSDHLLLFTN